MLIIVVLPKAFNGEEGTQLQRQSRWRRRRRGNVAFGAKSQERYDRRGAQFDTSTEVNTVPLLNYWLIEKKKNSSKISGVNTATSFILKWNRCIYWRNWKFIYLLFIIFFLLLPLFLGCSKSNRNFSSTPASMKQPDRSISTWISSISSTIFGYLKER